jgi:hypothetical protein
MMTRIIGSALVAGALALGLLGPNLAAVADAVAGEVQRQPLNVAAIIMFLIFVAATLGITYWAARRTKSAADSMPQAAVSPAFRTASPSPATTCRRPPSSASRPWSTRRAMTA